MDAFADANRTRTKVQAHFSYIEDATKHTLSHPAARAHTHNVRVYYDARR